MAALVYEGLYALDPTFTPQPRLCAEAQCNDDATVWTLTLRQDVRFSDGSSLRARDVAASLQRAKESARYGGRLAAVNSITESRGKVVLRLSRPNASLPALLDIPIVKSGTQDAAAPTGTGPYVLASDENGSFLRANADCGRARPCPRRPSVSWTAQMRAASATSSPPTRCSFWSRTRPGPPPCAPATVTTARRADTAILHCLLLNQKTALLQSAAVRPLP